MNPLVKTRSFATLLLLAPWLNAASTSPPDDWRCKNGKHLLWFHNHASKCCDPRNPVWLIGGKEKEGRIQWSEPELLLYHNGSARGMSYPDLIEQHGQYWRTETPQAEARAHLIDPTLLEGLWSQGELKTATTDGLLLDADSTQLTKGSITLPPLDLVTTKGMTLDFTMELETDAPGQVLLDSRNDTGHGWMVSTDKHDTLRVSLNDGKSSASWTSDAGHIQAGTTHHVAIVVDNCSRVIRFIIDGAFHDGEGKRLYGWTKYKAPLGNMTGSGTLSVAKELKKLRIYKRFLRTSKVIANYNSGR